jgi:predicted TIM-barrel fold metal-dependent hydrolase
VFSSDFPHEVNDESVTGEIDELWEREDLTREDKIAILKTNAQVFYGLDKQ